jgi:oligoendopeptidase F
MPFRPLPDNALEALTWTWADFEHHYDDLLERPVLEETLDAWLADWTKLANVVGEVESRLHVATTLDTEDKEAEARLNNYLETIDEPRQEAENRLKLKLIESGLTRSGLETSVKAARADAEAFCEANLPLQTELTKLGQEYDRLVGRQMVTLGGEELTMAQARLRLEEPDRAVREEAWRAISDRTLEDRAAFDQLWTKMTGLRRQMAANAGQPSLVELVWKQTHRFDYTPADCAQFRDAIAEVVVPLTTALDQARAEKLGVEKLRPWDSQVDIYGDQPLRPFRTEEELNKGAAEIFSRLDPVLAGHFDDMVSSRLIDLFSRKGKAPGGYCTSFPASGQPFVFMNAAGSHDDVMTLLHEAGHCFHVYEEQAQTWHLQKQVGAEFAEVASMGMEMLSIRHMDAYYPAEDARRAEIQQLERQLQFWPYMACVDGFQHWAHTSAHGDDPRACDEAWRELWAKFMPGVDWSGLEDVRDTGWHRKLHIFQIPFYYVEYGLAQMGALQVWQRAGQDQAQAVADYRKALSLGSSRSLPDLFAAAGGRFAFDAESLGELTTAMQTRLRELGALA